MLDPDIRLALSPTLRPAHGEGRLLGEVGIWGNTVRIDLARLTPSRLDGYEIKSDGDTLARLATQSSIYGMVCDTLTLVAARRHLDKAAAVLPEWWGLVEAVPGEGGVGLFPVREPSPNPSTSSERVAGLLWKDEAISALAAAGMRKGLSRLRAADAYRLLSQAMPIERLRETVSTAMLRRADWLDRHDPFFVGPFRPRTSA